MAANPSPKPISADGPKGTPERPVLRGALSVEEAAIYIGVSRATMYRLSAACGTSGLPVVHLGRRRVFRVAELDKYLERNTVHGGRG